LLDQSKLFLEALMFQSIRPVLAAAVLGIAHVSAISAPAYWADWGQQTAENGVTVYGAITTGSSTVNVTYNNPQGIAFLQNGAGTDYFANGVFSATRNVATSPYTSALVDNIPTAAEMIALRYAGRQSLHFSQAIANPVFSYVSLNGNGYGFNQDFDILSFGDVSNGNDCGFWGCGTSYKNVVDLGGGNFEYQLLGTGEPHGTIRFLGAFQDVSWRSLSGEYWNGFTVGVQGTAVEVFETPEPGSLALLGLGLVGVVALRRKPQV
jgi:hypothetical protein